MGKKRVFLLVMDSFGIGAMPDAEEFGDNNPNTLKAIAGVGGFKVSALKKMGLFNIDGVTVGERIEYTYGAYGRLKEASKGKDTTTGHWEMAGVISSEPMPTFPNGFPKDLIDALHKEFGRNTLCHQPYSGTQVIRDYGREHQETGALIIYTSADSVLQIAAHESVIPVEELYDYCKKARRLLVGKWGVGRVIARPFIGEYPNYERTSRRHDFSLEPPGITVIDRLKEANYETYGIGKIFDIFAGRSFSKYETIEDNDDGMRKTMSAQKEDFEGLCFINLVDFDMKYGHRRDAVGYASAVMQFDLELEKFILSMREGDILFVTADHGCDPNATGSDHTREYVPVLVVGKNIKENVNLGTKDSFSDIAATIEEYFGLSNRDVGKSFLKEILKG